MVMSKNKLTAIMTAVVTVILFRDSLETSMESYKF